jgi:hypothetical protein
MRALGARLWAGSWSMAVTQPNWNYPHAWAETQEDELHRLAHVVAYRSRIPGVSPGGVAAVVGSIGLERAFQSRPSRTFRRGS